MITAEKEPMVATNYWQLAFEPQYDHLSEESTYAGYIFRNMGGEEHNQRIDILDEKTAEQLVTWLNEREDLLAMRRN